MHFLFNAFIIDLILYNDKKRTVFAFFYVGLQATRCLFHALLIERSTTHFKRIRELMPQTSKKRLIIHGRSTRWSNLFLIQSIMCWRVSTRSVKLELMFASRKLPTTLETYFTQHFLWMVCFDKHPWIGTLKYNQLVKLRYQNYLPIIDFYSIS